MSVIERADLRTMLAETRSLYRATVENGNLGKASMILKTILRIKRAIAQDKYRGRLAVKGWV